MGRTVEKKRKKKGRPSLLDLQKRSLRLQKQQLLEEKESEDAKQRNPNPNPYLKFPNSGAAPRRATRRNPSPGEVSGGEGDGGNGEEKEEDEEEEGEGRRRERKLKLVLRMQPGEERSARDGAAAETSGSDSDAGRRGGRKKRSIDSVGWATDGSARDKTERHNPSKVTDPSTGEPADSEPTTLLPDKKLLEFILDRLQKKDTYGVFSEPVDTDELPDYHDIIKLPMDFSTVRKKLSSGAYANLEQFEKDVFLISSNAMRYNASDTIYFRQARSIQELARKDFENLRQESDDNEPEPKIVRRGRPPSKNSIKKPIGRPPVDHISSSVFADAAHDNASDIAMRCNSSNDYLRRAASDKPRILDSSARTFQVSRNTENYSLLADKKSERNSDSSVSMLKGWSMRYGKKVAVSEENRRNTYKQSPLMCSSYEPSVLTTFDGERKELIPVGLHIEHSYARSLARFAANLGPVAWEIAARKIERVLPPGTKFGRGWVGEKDAPQQQQPPLLSTSTPIPQPSVSPPPSLSKADIIPVEPSSKSAVDDRHPNEVLPAISPEPSASNRTSYVVDVAEISRGSSHETGYNVSTRGSVFLRAKVPLQGLQTTSVQPTVNGFNSGFDFDLSQCGQMARPDRQAGNMVSELPTTHARSHDAVSRSNKSSIHPGSRSDLEAEKAKLDNSNAASTGVLRPAAPSDSDTDKKKVAKIMTTNSSIMNPRSRFLQPVAANQLEIERKKLGNPSAINLESSSAYQPVTSHVEAERIKVGNPSTVNFNNNFARPSAISHMDTERIRKCNQGAVSAGAMRMEAATHSEGNRTSLAASSTINTGNTFIVLKEKSHSEVGKASLGNSASIIPSSHPSGSNQGSQGFWRGFSLHPKSDSAPPDLNVRFQSPGSPPSGVVVDSQQPDLALQL